jgi:hypothetical protein
MFYNPEGERQGFTVEGQSESYEIIKGLKSIGYEFLEYFYQDTDLWTPGDMFKMKDFINLP